MDIRAQLAFSHFGPGKGQSDSQVSVAPGDLSIPEEPEFAAGAA